MKKIFAGKPSATELTKALATAIDAARRAGELMRKNLLREKKINASHAHDIKLELDVRCQKLIERILRKNFAEIAILGEEGTTGDTRAGLRWVVDPIDGTVNFTHGIPHACVSIALQRRTRATKAGEFSDAAFETILGAVYDPFTDEMFTATVGGAAKLNGKTIRASSRARLNQAIVSIGFAKSGESLERMLPMFEKCAREARKVRNMGAAALAMVYVAAGRFDAYLETGVRLWDVAAGGLILECAGGESWHEIMDDDHTLKVIATNGRLRKHLQG
jgi:myo-inositol-1(or 4)-monophosphatase